jgi:hypothetical protein
MKFLKSGAHFFIASILAISLLISHMAYAQDPIVYFKCPSAATVVDNIKRKNTTWYMDTQGPRSAINGLRAEVSASPSYNTEIPLKFAFAWTAYSNGMAILKCDYVNAGLDKYNTASTLVSVQLRKDDMKYPQDWKEVYINKQSAMKSSSCEETVIKDCHRGECRNLSSECIFYVYP